MRISKLIFLIALILSSIITLSQNSADYVIIMTKQKQALNVAATEEDFEELANNFERIANIKTDEWHPLYYAALSLINKSFAGTENTAKDADLDNAQNFITKALEINPEESELWVLQGLTYQGRIQIDPVKRGKEFSIKANQALKKAIEYNPENPRAYYLQGLNILHTPKTIGGGAQAACPVLEKANEKFEKYQQENILSPSWGAEECLTLLTENCPQTGNPGK